MTLLRILAATPAGGSAQQFLAAIKKEIEVWRKVVNDAGVRTE